MVNKLYFSPYFRANRGASCIYYINPSLRDRRFRRDFRICISSARSKAHWSKTTPFKLAAHQIVPTKLHCIKVLSTKQASDKSAPLKLHPVNRPSDKLASRRHIFLKLIPSAITPSIDRPGLGLSDGVFEALLSPGSTGKINGLDKLF